MQGKTDWIPDPDKPSLLSYDNGELVDLCDSDPPQFATGDIIWFSFTATFAIGTRSWGPNFRLMELVRVGRITEPAEPITVDLSMFPPHKPSLRAGNNTLIDDGESTVTVFHVHHRLTENHAIDEDTIPELNLEVGTSTNKKIPGPVAVNNAPNTHAVEHNAETDNTGDVKATPTAISLSTHEDVNPDSSIDSEAPELKKRKRAPASDGDGTMSSDKEIEGSILDNDTMGRGTEYEKYGHRKVVAGTIPLKKRIVKGKSKA